MGGRAESSWWLVSERLGLRRFVASDLDNLARLDGSPIVMEHIGPPSTHDECAAWLKRAATEYDDEAPFGVWAAELRATGAFVGGFALKPLELDEQPEVQFGYRLLPTYWGQGLATEMGRRLVEYSLEELRLPQIVGIASPENPASARVLEKCGLIREGTTEFFNWRRNGCEEVSVYRLLAAK